MSGKDYGIESMADAFLALKDVDEDIEIKQSAKRKTVTVTIAAPIFEINLFI